MHLLVEWVNDIPKSWSVVSRDKLADGTLRKSKDLVGRTVGIQWKRTVHQAVVVETGVDRNLLEAKADNLAKELLQCKKRSEDTNQSSRRRPLATVNENDQASSSTAVNAGRNDAKKARAIQIRDVLCSIDPIVIEAPGETPTDPIPVAIPVPIPTVEHNVETNWEERYNDCKTKLRNLRTKYKSLKEVHSQCTNSEDYVEIWDGSEIKFLRSEVAALKTMSPSITFFARNLFRKAFTCEEIVGRSLLGRKSTVLKDRVPLPSVDAKRRDAIIEFCLKSYGFEVLPEKSGLKAERKRKTAKTRIIKSLSDFVREENAKANQLMNVSI